MSHTCWRCRGVKGCDPIPHTRWSRGNSAAQNMLTPKISERTTAPLSPRGTADDKHPEHAAATSHPRASGSRPPVSSSPPIRSPAPLRDGIHAPLPNLFGNPDLRTVDERFNGPGPRLATLKGSSAHTRERPDGYATAPSVVKWESWSPAETAENLRQIRNLAMGDENSDPDAEVDLGELLTRMRQLSDEADEEENAAYEAELGHGNVLIARHGDRLLSGYDSMNEAPPFLRGSESSLPQASYSPVHPAARHRGRTHSMLPRRPKTPQCPTYDEGNQNPDLRTATPKGNPGPARKGRPDGDSPTGEHRLGTPRRN